MIQIFQINIVSTSLKRNIKMQNIPNDGEHAHSPDGTKKDSVSTTKTKSFDDSSTRKKGTEVEYSDKFKSI
jgi:hypothetical protein